jgi:hypothetical protein
MGGRAGSLSRSFPRMARPRSTPRGEAACDPPSQGRKGADASEEEEPQAVARVDLAVEARAGCWAPPGLQPAGRRGETWRYRLRLHSLAASGDPPSEEGA